MVGEPPSFEEALDRLRDAARQENFLVGARLVSSIHPAEAAGRAYAAVADACVAIALREARRDMARAHGEVPGFRAAVLALGRLGVRDLTATSDLDLVILYDAPDMDVRSDGARPIDPVTWAQRLAQRLVTALTAPTRRGTLYDVDLRLRPQGGKGPLAVRLSSFRDYQASEAELWEHMALTKARFCAGDLTLGEEAMAVVREVLSRPRDPAKTRGDVLAMRRLIAEAKGDKGAWDLKMAPGGLTDVDFAVEGLVLVRAAEAPELVGLDLEATLALAAERGWISASDSVGMAEAARQLNAAVHWLRLAIDGEFDPKSAPPAVGRMIAKALNAPTLSALSALLGEARGRVKEIGGRWLS